MLSTPAAGAALTAATPQLRDVLTRAESFIAGFEGDELQEGVDTLLADLRAVAPTVSQIAAVLAEAAQIIEFFHGPIAWETYWNHSPEMKRLRTAQAAVVAGATS